MNLSTPCLSTSSSLGKSVEKEFEFNVFVLLTPCRLDGWIAVRLIEIEKGAQTNLANNEQILRRRKELLDFARSFKSFFSLLRTRNVSKLQLIGSQVKRFG